MGWTCQADWSPISDADAFGTHNKASAEIGFQNQRYGELAMPSSVHNWERDTGFHAVALLMERLLATQQFELALEVSRLVFDPSQDDAKCESAFEHGAARKPLSRLDRS